jgi:lipoate-protein ligase A
MTWETSIIASFIVSVTFIKSKTTQVIIEALKAFDIKAKTQGQSNLVVETSQGERKISGSAFKQKKDRSFHHGTLLIDSDIELLINCLKDQKLEIESKSIDSNRAKSINLKELNPTIELQNMVDRIIQCFGPKNISKFTQRDFTESMQTESNRLQSWDWLIGETPYFEARVESKKLMSKKGLILEGSEIGEIGSRVQSLLDK